MSQGLFYKDGVYFTSPQGHVIEVTEAEYLTNKAHYDSLPSFVAVDDGKVANASDISYGTGSVKDALDNALPKNVFDAVGNQPYSYTPDSKNYAQYLCVFTTSNGSCEIALVSFRSASDGGIKYIYSDFGSSHPITLVSGNINSNYSVWYAFTVTKLR